MSCIALALWIVLLSLACTADAIVPAPAETRASMLVANVDLMDLAPPDRRYDEADDATRAGWFAPSARRHQRNLKGHTSQMPDRTIDVAMAP